MESIFQRVFSVREMFSFNENAESLTCLCLFFGYKLNTFDL